MIETVKHITDLGKTVSHISQLSVLGIMQDIQLYIEKLFELETVLRQLEFLAVLREMDYTKSVIE